MGKNDKQEQDTTKWTVAWEMKIIYSSDEGGESKNLSAFRGAILEVNVFLMQL